MCARSWASSPALAAAGARRRTTCGARVRTFVFPRRGPHLNLHRPSLTCVNAARSASDRTASRTFVGPRTHPDNQLTPLPRQVIQTVATSACEQKGTPTPVAALVGPRPHPSDRQAEHGTPRPPFCACSSTHTAAPPKVEEPGSIPDTPEGMAALSWTHLKQLAGLHLDEPNGTHTPLAVVAALGPGCGVPQRPDQPGPRRPRGSA